MFKNLFFVRGRICVRKQCVTVLISEKFGAAGEKFGRTGEGFGAAGEKFGTRSGPAAGAERAYKGVSRATVSEFSRRFHRKALDSTTNHGGVMARSSPLVERTLPLNLPVPVAQPTGEVFDTRQPYTLPLNKRLALAHCLGPFTEIDRKLWATLVALAWDDLAIKSIHEANARDIARLFRELKGGQSGCDWVMASARRLAASRLDWEDETETGMATLLSGLKIMKISGAIFYQFSDFLIDKLRDNSQFSRLRLHFMIGLSGKYSVTLYMLLESVANQRRPVVEMTIDELRQALSVPAGKLSRWVDLNRFAIEPAVKQINDNASAAGFAVEAAPILKGRKFERVRFTVTKADLRLADESRFRISHRRVAADDETPARQMPRYQIDDALVIIRREARGLDAQMILSEFESWLKSNKEPVKNQLGALTEFAKRKKKQQKGFFDDNAGDE
ncbi:MAG: replication initiation protein [Methylobacteriaceae bacterium]|nr:replication initiation protein [Methylobacteriaceae bacterium]